MATVEREVFQTATVTVEICDTCGADIKANYGRITMCGDDWVSKGNKFVLCEECACTVLKDAMGQSQ